MKMICGFKAILDKVVPINWLNDFVDTIEDVGTTFEKIDMSGSSVEHWEGY